MNVPLQSPGGTTDIVGIKQVLFFFSLFFPLSRTSTHVHSLYTRYSILFQQIFERSYGSREKQVGVHHDRQSFSSTT